MPTKPNQGEPIPDFAPVPLRYRHDGWTPERQKAFIAALADTGSVSRATAMVNMSLEGVYHLRRMPGAEEFRRAWEAALDFGVARLKDIAFERAIEGEMVPMFQKGKLMGFQRKRNDRLLMFCLRHYGQDAQGRRTTINYFSTRASATAGSAGAGAVDAAAEASTTVLRTVISGNCESAAPDARGDVAAAALNGFDGVELDGEARAEIAAALEACAARWRERDSTVNAVGPARIAAQMEDADEDFVRIGERDSPYWGTLESGTEFAPEPFRADEPSWQNAGAPLPDWMAAIAEKSGAEKSGAEKSGAEKSGAEQAGTEVAEVRQRSRKSNRKKRSAAGGE